MLILFSLVMLAKSCYRYLDTFLFLFNSYASFELYGLWKISWQYGLWDEFHLHTASLLMLIGLSVLLVGMYLLNWKIALSLYQEKQ